MSQIIDNVVKQGVDALNRAKDSGTATVEQVHQIAVDSLQHAQTVGNNLVSKAEGDVQAANSRLDNFMNNHHWQIIAGIVALVSAVGLLAWARIHGAG